MPVNVRFDDSRVDYRGANHQNELRHHTAVLVGIAEQSRSIGGGSTTLVEHNTPQGMRRRSNTRLEDTCFRGIGEVQTILGGHASPLHLAT